MKYKCAYCQKVVSTAQLHNCNKVVPINDLGVGGIAILEKELAALRARVEELEEAIKNFVTADTNDKDSKAWQKMLEITGLKIGQDE